MDTTITHINSVPKRLTNLNKIIPGEIKQVGEHYILYLDPSIGTGEIRYINLRSGLKTFDFNFTLKSNIEIPFNFIEGQTLQFMFCMEGSFTHKFEDHDQAVRIDQYQTAVSHCDKGLPSRIFVQKDQNFVLNVIFVDKSEYFIKFDEDVNHFDQRIQELLKGIGEKHKYFHAGTFSLKIAEQFKLLIQVEHSNEIAEILSQKGRYYLILAQHIEKFCAEIDENENTSGLLKTELKKITEVCEDIKAQPELQHSIKSLCLTSGLSPAKLQEGFKFMFDRTVSDFVRNIRLEKAEDLIRNTDLTISEVVYSVGLTSRSYFCKIFKKKYNYSPKEYKLKVQRAMLLRSLEEKKAADL
ncbi:AraC family transcriptional regulator [Aquimarina sp. ERC-38]|uniref:helix-turn-helix transcriptional regulator n=1 Tax=Aquimarina sp. ERC-38 TaxID=2949996 RepID=UPI002247E513|nr:AraC family transcriptional regulator [Aquimarina sp. ERC-38]UZO81102.1 AraC family transcriptional regulator [Aquimarina sp. ERC-38]